MNTTNDKKIGGGGEGGEDKKKGNKKDNKKPAVIKDPLQATKMKQMVNQSIHGLGQNIDLSQYSHDEKHQILQQRLRQKRYLIGMQRTNITARQASMGNIEERMKNMIPKAPVQEKQGEIINNNNNRDKPSDEKSTPGTVAVDAVVQTGDETLVQQHVRLI